MEDTTFSSANPEYFELIKRLPLFQDASVNQIKELARSSNFSVLKQGGELLKTEQSTGSLYIVLQGAVQVSMISKEGHEFVIAILSRGDVLDSFLSAEDINFFIASSIIFTTRSPTIVMRLSWADLFHIFDRSSCVAIIERLLKECSAALLLRIEDLAMYSLDARLARVLLRLHAKSTSIADLRLHRFNQTTLALLVNGSRSKVNQHLQRFVLNGAIQLINGCVRVME